MLTKIREKTQGIIASFILILIVIPFALWGINSYFEAGPRASVAEVNGAEITQIEYRRALEPLRNRLSPQVVETREFKQQLLESLIEQTLAVRDAEERGFRVADARLAQMIRQEPFFQSAGQFDPQRYQAFLQQEGLTARDFEDRLRGQNLTAQVQRGLVDSAIVTDAEVEALVRLMRQERDLAYVVLAPAALAAQVALTPQEVADYYAAHPELGRSPEELRVAYLRLSMDDIVAGYRPSAEEIEKAYAEEAGRYTRPAKRRASHILIEVGGGEGAEQKARERGEALARELRAGADFAALARKASDDKDSAARGGDLGEIRAGQLPKELEAALGALKPGELSAPVRTQYGYHLVKLTAFTPEARRPLAEVRVELIKQVQAQRGEERFYELAEKFRDLVYAQSESLEPAAQALGLTVQTSGWFTRSGGGGISDPRLIEAAFQPEVVSRARNSDAVELNPRTLVAVRAIDHRPEARAPLEALRPQIERLLREDRARAQARERGEALLKRLRGGEPLAALARAEGLKLESRGAVTREAPQGLDRRLLQAAFAAGRPAAGGAVYAGVELGVSGYALLAVTRVADPDPSRLDAALREKTRRPLAERRGGGYYSAYRAGLRQQAEVKTYPDKL